MMRALSRCYYCSLDIPRRASPENTFQLRVYSCSYLKSPSIDNPATHTLQVRRQHADLNI